MNFQISGHRTALISTQYISLQNLGQEHTRKKAQDVNDLRQYLIDA